MWVVWFQTIENLFNILKTQNIQNTYVIFQCCYQCICNLVIFLLTGIFGTGVLWTWVADYHPEFFYYFLDAGYTDNYVIFQCYSQCTSNLVIFFTNQHFGIRVFFVFEFSRPGTWLVWFQTIIHCSQCISNLMSFY